MFISGENADQLFGSQVNDEFALNRPYADLFKPIATAQGDIIDFFTNKLTESKKQYAERIFLLFKKIIDAAPIELDTIYKFFWWINFTTKWQSVYMRAIPYSSNPTSIKLEENYTTFYNPPEFQLWAMNNTNSFVKDTANTTKYIPKEYIYNFNKDEHYLKKPKIGSLGRMLERKKIGLTIDNNMNFSDDFPNETCYNYDNDFVKMK